MGYVRAPYNPHTDIRGGGELTAQEQGRARAIARNAINPGTLTPTDHAIEIRRPEDPASDSQMNFLSSLVIKYAKINAEDADRADQWIQGHYRAGTFTKGMAHDAINRMKDHLGLTPVNAADLAPRSAMAPATPPRAQVDRYEDVPAGYYCLRRDDVAHFYRITRNDNGRWYVQEQASDNLYPVRNFRQANDIMAGIREAGPRVSAELYAELIERCYVCGRTLTDDDSRRAGIGPVCAAKGSMFG